MNSELGRALEWTKFISHGKVKKEMGQEMGELSVLISASARKGLISLTLQKGLLLVDDNLLSLMASPWVMVAILFWTVVVMAEHHAPIKM